MLPVCPTEICEEILRAGVRYNVENEILPSENAIAERLLSRRIELVDAYKELYGKLPSDRHALETFLGALLSTAAFWSPEKLANARKGRERLDVVNQEIAIKAIELARLLDERSGLHNYSQFHSDTHYDVCDVIDSAASGNYLFESHVRERLAGLSAQFDLKYWPTLGDFARALASDAETAGAEASDPLTAAGTKTSRPSLADFFKAFFASINEQYGLPKGFKLTDGAYASLANCALDLEADKLVDGAYVKRLRQRQREVGPGRELHHRDDRDPA